MTSIQRSGTQTALWSFLIGTILLLYYYLTGSSDIFPASLLFIFVAGIINLVIVALLIRKVFTDNSNSRTYAKTIGLMLLNIPVALLYFYFVTILMNTMRISFLNETGQRIEDLTILGGPTPIKYAALEAHESRNAWIPIQGDGAVRIAYRVGSEIREEDVSGYITTGMGTKVKFEIGKSKEINY
ncbi:MAG: hypothetical protein WCR52_17305 [Bacteroidota bacterium]|uniref:hypothetical protein n=1 Tax=Runella sp. TaxID=1960881 RepID=UPI003015BEC3